MHLIFLIIFLEKKFAMYPNGANQSFNPYQPAYPTYLQQAASVLGQTAVQLPYMRQPQIRQPQPIPTQQTSYSL